MGKSAPAPPAAPDPVKTAQAQGAINRDAAVDQQRLNMVDEYTPYGSSVYTPRGSTGGIQQFNRTTTLDPAQQNILNKSNEVTNRLSDVALQQTGRVKSALGDNFSYDGQPAAGSLDGARSAADRTSSLAGRDLDYSGLSDAPSSSGINDAANIAAQSVSDPFSLEGSAPTTGGISGAADRAEAGMANEFNYNGLPGSFNSQGARNAVQGATDAWGDALDYEGAPEAPQADAAARQQVIDSMYEQQTSRLDPRFAREQQAMETQLANSGIARGTDAFSASMGDFNRGKNDAYQGARNSAIQAGGAEQSRLFGLGTTARGNSIAERNYLRNLVGQEQGQLLGYQGALSGLQGRERGDAALERMTERSVPIQEAAQLQGLRGAEFDSASAARGRSVQEQLLQRGMPAQEQAQLQQMRGAAFAASGAERDRSMQDMLTQRAVPLNEQQQAYNMQSGLFGLDQSARARGIEESAYLRNIPLNETTALMSGSQVNNPTFSSTPQAGVAAADYTGLVNNQYKGQLDAYKTANASKNATTGGLFGLAGKIGGGLASSGAFGPGGMIAGQFMGG